jgi:predicted HAD superfamily hydrolase
MSHVLVEVVRSTRNAAVSLAEDALKSLKMGKEVVLEKNKIRNLPSEKKIYILRNWDSIIDETEKRIPYDVSLKEIFTDEEQLLMKNI